MTREEFEQLVAGEFERAIPEEFRSYIKNVAFLIEEEPSPELRQQEKLRPHETLLGYYHGIPVPMRGDWYGMGTTMPDTITLFQKPIEEVAREENKEVARVVRETIWHEVAHHFGFDEARVRARERERKKK
jgi:predicted Zn-dependent protease with MMP-like domain